MVVLLLLLQLQFPAADETSWMEPASFHLDLGEPRSEVEASFAARGWRIERDDDGTFIHDYAEGKVVTMEFRKDRLTSIRFELVSLRPRLSDNWEQVKSRLRDRFGDPEVEKASLLLTGTEDEAVHAVLEDDLDSSLGKQGAGRIIVRYFVPVEATGSTDPTR